MQNYDEIETVQNLWDYCTFCPICKNHSRNIGLNLANLQFSYKKENQYFFFSHKNIDAAYGFDHYYHYKINCQNNIVEESDGSHPSCDLHINSHCLRCDSFSLGQFEIFESKIKNLSLLKDNILLSDGIYLYDITLLYYCNSMIVSKWNPDKEIHAENEVSIPIVHSLLKMDFSDKNKVFNKINTLLMFS